MLVSLARAWSRHVPLEFGKWRLHEYLDRRVAGRTGTVRTRDGVRMHYDTADFIQRTIYIQGSWEEHIAHEVRALRPGELFVDCGANVGFFSLLAASRGAEVIAFEPNPPTHAQLMRNAAMNGFAVDARCIALGERPGTTFLELDQRGNSGAAHLSDTGEATVAVELDTLDNQLAGRVPRLVKIDVEGAEILLLRGATEVLRAGPPIIMEVSEFSLTRMGGSKEELFALMAAAGYTARLLSRPSQSNATLHGIFFQYDVLFSR